jgi:predicted outer membrane repeat protein
MHDVLFEGNTAGITGGAIRSVGAAIAMRNVAFEGNSAISAGALDAGLNGGYLMSISDSSFRRNEAIGAGGQGGAIYLLGSDGRAIFDGVTFSGNSSGFRGGAIIAIEGNSPRISMANCTITGNAAGLYGGGVNYQDQTSDIQLANDSHETAGSAGGCKGGRLYGLFGAKLIIAGNSDLDTKRPRPRL